MWGAVTGAWPEGEIYKHSENEGKGQPFIGAIAVVDTSHVGFVVGKNKSRNIILLVGNPSDQIKLSPFKFCKSKYYLFLIILILIKKQSKSFPHKKQR